MRHVRGLLSLFSLEYVIWGSREGRKECEMQCETKRNETKRNGMYRVGIPRAENGRDEWRDWTGLDWTGGTGLTAQGKRKTEGKNIKNWAEQHRHCSSKTKS